MAHPAQQPPQPAGEHAVVLVVGHDLYAGGDAEPAEASARASRDPAADDGRSVPSPGRRDQSRGGRRPPPGCDAAAYSRAPQPASSSLNRQSTIAQRGSSRWAATRRGINQGRVRHPAGKNTSPAHNHDPGIRRLTCRAPEGCRARLASWRVAAPASGSRSERRGRSRHGGGRRGEAWRKPCGKPCPRSDAFVQREPQEGAEPAQCNRVPRRLRRRHAVREGAGVRHRAGQDRHLPHAPRRRVAVRLDSRPGRLVPRPAHGVRVRRQPGRREAGSLLVQRHQQRRQLGRGLGRHGRRATQQGWTAPSSGFRFRSCASRRRDTITFGFAVSRDDRPAASETSTWPLLARSANGYVSSFGELGGLSTGRGGEAARAHAVHRRQPDAAAPRAATRC